MPGDLYLFGQRLGRSVASDSRQEIEMADGSEALGRLAGEKLFALHNWVEKSTYDQKNFKIGFFDGFQERAELMKSAREGL